MSVLVLVVVYETVVWHSAGSVAGATAAEVTLVVSILNCSWCSSGWSGSCGAATTVVVEGAAELATETVTVLAVEAVGEASSPASVLITSAFGSAFE